MFTFRRAPLGSSDLLLLVCSAFPCRVSTSQNVFLSLPTREPVILPLLGSAPGHAPPSATQRQLSHPPLTLSTRQQAHVGLSVSESLPPKPALLQLFSFI